MNAIILLFLAGVVLLVFEVITPGAVLGILGGLAMLGGCAVAFHLYGVTGGSIAAAVGLGILALALYVEFVLLPKTKVGRKMFLHRTVEAISQPPIAAPETVVGKDCESLTMLAPSGYVLLEGRRYEAFSQSGLVPKGVSLRVTGVDNFRLIVNKSLS